MKSDKLPPKKVLRFLKEEGFFEAFKYERLNHPNEYCTPNALNDLKSAINSAYDMSPFHMRTKGFDRSRGKYGEDFWCKVNDKFKVYLKKHNIWK